MAQHSVSNTLFLLTLLAGASALGASPARAGFQWTPPPAATAPAATPVTTKATTRSGPPMPVMAEPAVEKTPISVHTTPVTPPTPSEKTIPGTAFPAQLMKDATITSAPEKDVEKTPEREKIQGFGNAIPLALALRQIVPAQFGYVFDTAVNRAAPLSWNANNTPWDVVLGAALKTLGYGMEIDGNGLRILAHPPVSPALKKMEAPQKIATEKTATARPVQIAPAQQQTTAPVREVYIRRNIAGEEVEERVPGTPEDITPISPDGTNARTQPIHAESAETAETVHAKQKARLSGPILTNQNTPTQEQKSQNTTQNTAQNMTQNMTGQSAPGNTAQPILLSRAPGEVSPPAPEVTNETTNETTAAPSPLGAANVRFWQAEDGDSLKNVLQSWSETAHVRLFWVPAQDYKLPRAIRLEGNYADAVAAALSAYGDRQDRPVGRLHPNLPNGPAVLVIEPASATS